MLIWCLFPPNKAPQAMNPRWPEVRRTQRRSPASTRRPGRKLRHTIPPAPPRRRPGPNWEGHSNEARRPPNPCFPAKAGTQPGLPPSRENKKDVANVRYQAARRTTDALPCHPVRTTPVLHPKPMAKRQTSPKLTPSHRTFCRTKPFQTCPPEPRPPKVSQRVNFLHFRQENHVISEPKA